MTWRPSPSIALGAWGRIEESLPALKAGSDSSIQAPIMRIGLGAPRRPIPRQGLDQGRRASGEGLEQSCRLCLAPTEKLGEEG